jgi:hypothetical protein
MARLTSCWRRATWGRVWRAGGSGGDGARPRAVAPHVQAVAGPRRLPSPTAHAHCPLPSRAAPGRRCAQHALERHRQQQQRQQRAGGLVGAAGAAVKKGAAAAAAKAAGTAAPGARAAFDAAAPEPRAAPEGERAQRGGDAPPGDAGGGGGGPSASGAPAAPPAPEAAVLCERPLALTSSAEVRDFVCTLRQLLRGGGDARGAAGKETPGGAGSPEGACGAAAPASEDSGAGGGSADQREHPGSQLHVVFIDAPSLAPRGGALARRWYTEEGVAGMAQASGGEEVRGRALGAHGRTGRMGAHGLDMGAPL